MMAKHVAESEKNPKVCKLSNCVEGGDIFL